nr:zinc finger protein 92 homolog [Chelonoidis abingdonii]
MVMAAAGSVQLQVAFEDVALYFTREEWELLSQPEKQLYQNQMLRNYRALVFLGTTMEKPGKADDPSAKTMDCEKAWPSCGCSILPLTHRRCDTTESGGLVT